MSILTNQRLHELRQYFADQDAAPGLLMPMRADEAFPTLDALKKA